MFPPCEPLLWGWVLSWKEMEKGSFPSTSVLDNEVGDTTVTHPPPLSKWNSSEWSPMNGPDSNKWKNGPQTVVWKEGEPV